MALDIHILRAELDWCNGKAQTHYSRVNWDYFKVITVQTVLGWKHQLVAVKDVHSFTITTVY